MLLELRLIILLMFFLQAVRGSAISKAKDVESGRSQKTSALPLVVSTWGSIGFQKANLEGKIAFF